MLTRMKPEKDFLPFVAIGDVESDDFRTDHRVLGNVDFEGRSSRKFGSFLVSVDDGDVDECLDDVKSVCDADGEVVVVATFRVERLCDDDAALVGADVKLAIVVAARQCVKEFVVVLLKEKTFFTLV